MEHPEAQASPPAVDAAPAPWAPTQAPDAGGPVLGPRTKRRTGVVVAWWAGALALVVLAVVAAFMHVAAHETFDAAEARLQAAAEEEADAHRSLTAATSAAERSVLSGEQILAAATDELVHPDARAAFAEELETLSGGTDEARALLDDDAVDDAAARKPFWTWELFAEASALDDRSRDASASIEDFTGTETTVDDRHEQLTGAAIGLYASTVAAADALEVANVSARSAAVLDFRDAADQVAQQDDVGSDAAVAFSVYASRTQELVASARSELAEKAGPLLETRLEIEAFARSIAGGVVLDFDWAPVVAGTGGPRGIGGTATWDSARGGSSTITLSHSVAEWWPNADSRALVAHEVGHSITSKCHDKFDSQNADANEEWATAWAISMGHTAEGNGVQAYGYPSQEMIDLAATCR